MNQVNYARISLAVDFISTFALAFGGGVLSIFLPCSLFLIPALALNNPLSRGRLFYFILGLTAGTALFILLITMMKTLFSPELLLIAGVALLGIGCFQVFQAYKKKDCDTCNVQTKRSTSFLLGIISTGFYGCTLAPVAGALVYAAAGDMELIFALGVALSYVIGRVGSLLGLITLPLSFYIQRFFQGKRKELPGLLAGLAMAPLGFYLLHMLWS